jgi:hypothetical protein
MFSPCQAPTPLQILERTPFLFRPLILTPVCPSIRCQCRPRSTEEAFSYAGGIVTIV